MTHRADQIVVAAAAIIRTAVTASGWKVYEHRRLSLAEDENELPAHSVDFGADVLLTELTYAIDSQLAVLVTTIVAGATEQLVRQELLKGRRAAHVALMANRSLALPFVMDIAYDGAEAPEIDFIGENIAGALTSLWQVHYRFDPNDPGDD